MQVVLRHVARAALRSMDADVVLLRCGVQVGELFPEIDTLCDQIWFNQTVTQDELPRILEQCLVSKEMFQLNGKDSGLLLHATMGKQINKKTSTRARLLIRSAISRAPVTDPCNLLQELVDIQGLFNEMCQQGTAPEPQIRMSILDNAISKLKANPKLTLILVNPDRLYPRVINSQAVTLGVQG